MPKIISRSARARYASIALWPMIALLGGCAALPTRYADATPPARFDNDAPWVLAPAYLDPAYDGRPAKCEVPCEPPTPREPQGFVAHAVAAELRSTFGSRPRNLYDVDIRRDQIDPGDATKLCAALRELGGVKYLAIVAAFSREDFRIGSSRGGVDLRVEVWDVQHAQLSFVASDTVHRETPLLWVYHYWDMNGDLTPIGRDDIRAAAERLAAKFEESRATTTSVASRDGSRN